MIVYDRYDLYDLYDLAHVAGWEPYNLPHDLSLAQVSWVGSVQCADPAPSLTAADEELDDLLYTDHVRQIDHDLPET